jgi:predicted nucleic acid-binding protein
VPVARAPHLPLIGRIWDLRANLTSYDAAYVALAEVLDSVLVTADRALGGASGVECEVEVLS